MHDLARFASVARAVSVWFGFEVLAGDRRRIEELVRSALRYLDDPSATVGDDPLEAYLSLWARATVDVETAIEQAERLLTAPDSEQRFAAAYFLAETDITAVIPALTRALSDDDLRVAAVAVGSLAGYRIGELPRGEMAESYDVLVALLARVPKKTHELQAVSWLGPLPALRRESVAELLYTHVTPPHVDRVLPHAKALDTWVRGRLVVLLAEGPLTAERRAALLGFLSDASADVRERAIVAMRELELSDDEALALEPLLKRKPGDLRRGVLELIGARGDPWALDAAMRLLTGDEQQRLGAVDLLRRVGAGDSAHAGPAREALTALEAKDKTVVGDASRRAVADDPLTRLNEGDGFGLFDEAGLTAPFIPRRTGFSANSPAALRVIALLDRLIDANAEVEIVTERWG